MLSGGGQLVKTFFFYIIDDGIVFFRLTDDRADRAVLAACKDEQLVHGLAGAERLDDSVSSLYHAACKLLIRLLYFLFSVSVTVISFPLKSRFFPSLLSKFLLSFLLFSLISFLFRGPKSSGNFCFFKSPTALPLLFYFLNLICSHTSPSPARIRSIIRL